MNYGVHHGLLTTQEQVASKVAIIGCSHRAYKSKYQKCIALGRKERYKNIPVQLWLKFKRMYHCEFLKTSMSAISERMEVRCGRKR